MRRLIVGLSVWLIPVAVCAQTLTPRDIIQLSKGGLGEEALLALIEVHRTVFPVDVETLKSLKDGGVAPHVIIAMIKSGRTPPPPLPLPQPLELPAPPHPVDQPTVIVIEHEREPRIREVAVPIPVYIPVRVRSRVDRDDDGHSRPPQRAEPVYWGWGGKLRPDGWKPSVAEVQKDARVPIEPQKK